MNKCTINVEDRNYLNYSVINVDNSKKEISFKNPEKNKLFNGDLFIMDQDNITIIESRIRNSIHCGVLILNKDKTYGIKNDKKLYKCIPNDKKIPIFLIAFKIKKLDFNKNIENRFVLFKFKDWESKHPHGELVNNIGSISNMNSFYEYKLLSKNLNISLQHFQKQILKKIKNQDRMISDIIENNNLQDRRSLNIFSIDNLTTTDFDDAIGIQELGENKHIISIYISNVNLWIEYLDIWNDITDKTTSIYLLDKKRPMLPSILSENLCSLVKNEIRFAFTLDLVIENDTVVDTIFNNTIVNLHENYRYEEKILKKNKDYSKIFKIVKNLSEKNHILSIENSHDVVSYLMIIMNYYSSLTLSNNKEGIFKKFKINKDNFKEVPKEIENFVKIWNSESSSYVDFNNKDGHDLLKLDSYVHITSPIRRIVDLVNIYKIQVILGLFKENNDNLEFYNKWIKNLDYVNSSMKSAKKIQNQCSLLEILGEEQNKMLKNYKGFIINKIKRDEINIYDIYIPDLKIVSKVKTIEEKDNFSNHYFNILLFEKEDTFEKKIKLQFN